MKAYLQAVDKKDSWLEQLGLEVNAEQAGKELSESSSNTTTVVSEVPEAWGQCESIFPTDVPPHWKEEVLRTVLLTQSTSTELCYR